MEAVSASGVGLRSDDVHPRHRNNPDWPLRSRFADLALATRWMVCVGRDS